MELYHFKFNTLTKNWLCLHVLIKQQTPDTFFVFPIQRVKYISVELTGAVLLALLTSTHFQPDCVLTEPLVVEQVEHTVHKHISSSVVQCTATQIEERR